MAGCNSKKMAKGGMVKKAAKGKTVKMAKGGMMISPRKAMAMGKKASGVKKFAVGGAVMANRPTEQQAMQNFKNNAMMQASGQVPPRGPIQAAAPAQAGVPPRVPVRGIRRFKSGGSVKKGCK